MDNIHSEVAEPLRSNRRQVRNILIHKPMQKEFVFIVIALLMTSMIFVAYVIHLTIQDAAMGGGMHFGRINPYEIFSDLRYELILRVGMVWFFTLTILGFFGVFFLHRIAGPVYRFRSIFMKVNDGNVPAPILLRGNDFFSETAQEINVLLAHLKAEKDKNEVLLKKVRYMIQSNPPALILEALKDIEKDMTSR